MTELNSLQLPQGGEYYAVIFQRVRFALLDAPPLSELQAFSGSNQAQLGKTEVRMQVSWMATYLSFFRDINYVLLTQYQEILLLPFLLRRCPEIRVVATSLMYQLARIHLLTFQEKVQDFDATSSELPYDQDMRIRDAYEAKFELDLTNSPTVFSLKEAQDALSKVIKVNYFQVYDTERGVSLVAHPSGKNNGSCLWEMEGATTREKVLLVNDISQHQWRTCQPYNLPRLKLAEQQKPFDLIVLTRRALARLNSENEEQRTAETLAKITNNINNSISTVIVLNDETTAVDLIPRIAFQPEGKCQAAFFSGSSLHDFTNFCNSYVDYLSDAFRNIIFSESPDYPLIHYSKLSDKGLIHIHGLEDTAIRKKLPVREIVLQNAPFVLFLKNYEHYLQTEDLSAIYQNTKFEEIPITIENNFTKAHLEKFLSTFSKAKVYCFGDDPGIGRVSALAFNIKHRVGEQSQSCFMRAANLTTSRIHKYTLVNNELILKPFSKEVIVLPRAFLDRIFNEFVKKAIPVLHKDAVSLRTEHTVIHLSEEYVLKVKSSNVDELFTLERILTPMIERQSVP